MKAVAYRRRGNPEEVLEAVTSPEPAQPAPGNITARVTLSPTHPGDLLGIYGDAGEQFSPKNAGFEAVAAVLHIGEVYGP